MPTKAFSQAKLLGADNTISVTSLSADIPITEKLATVDDLPSTGVIGEQAFVEETNRLYIWNGSGWYNIALINTTPTWDSGGPPAAAYELSADSPQTATTITLAASDPEGLSINYSYVTSGSMDSMSTISQDSSVFTITPKTLAQMGGAGNEGPHTGSITFRVTDGVNVLPQVSSFTLNFISTISRHTIMHVNAIAASDNNNITDASSNNHSITVNGDCSAGTFSPFRSGGYSTYFDGTTDYIEHQGTFTLPSGTNANWTIECWVNLDQVNLNQGILRVSSTAATGNNDDIYFSEQSGYINVACKAGGINSATSNYTMTANVWHHIAMVKNNGTVYLYNNGVYCGSVSDSNDYSGSYYVYAGLYYSSSYCFAGYLTDFRISNTAKYTSGTSNFSVPTERLSSDSSTLFLTCHLPYIADGSTNNHAITLNGDVSTKPFAPYDYEEYNAAANGGSIYFDGTSDNRVIVAHDASLNPSGAWTIECWFYLTDMTDFSSIFSKFDNSTSNRSYHLRINSDGSGRVIMSSAGSASDKGYTFTPTSGAFTTGLWYHFAQVYDGSGTYKYYVNGVAQTDYSWSGTPYAGSADFLIGTWQNGSTHYGDLNKAYVSDLRLVIGTAVYSGASLTVPTEPLGNITNTKLLVKGTDASIVDTAQGTHIECVGSAAGTSSPAKFPGTYSLSLPGFGHWMPSPMKSVKLSGTEDWTVEAWVYPTQRQSYSVVVSCGSSFALALGMVAGNFHVYNNSAGGFTDTDVNHGTYDIAANQWTHLAATRVNGNWYCYVNGTLRYQKTGGSWQSHVMNETTQYTIGAVDGFSSFSGNERWYGNVQDVRITKGLARYTGNFTAPTTPLEG